MAGPGRGGRPTSTATDPARSLAKWIALDANAGLSYRRAARSDTTLRLRSIAITTPMTANAHQVASISPSLPPTRRETAKPAMHDAERDQDRGLGERREVLGLPVTVRVAAVGRPDRHADGEEGQQRGDEVGAGVRRLGHEPEAAACDPGCQLDRDQDDRGDDRDERDPALRRHAGRLTPPGAGADNERNEGPRAPAPACSGARCDRARGRLARGRPRPRAPRRRARRARAAPRRGRARVPEPARTARHPRVGGRRGSRAARRARVLTAARGSRLAPRGLACVRRRPRRGPAGRRAEPRPRVVGRVELRQRRPLLLDVAGPRLRGGASRRGAPRPDRVRPHRRPGLGCRPAGLGRPARAAPRIRPCRGLRRARRAPRPRRPARRLRVRPRVLRAEPRDAQRSSQGCSR